MTSFRKSKKGAFEISLSELIGGILAVIIIFSLVYVGGKLTGILTSKKDYDSTINSFEVLTGRIKDILQGEDFSTTTMLYTISDKYILAGFNYKDQSKEISTQCTNENIEKTRPKPLCQEKSCLCIYNDLNPSPANLGGKDFSNKEFPLKCEAFEGNIVFLAPLNEKDKSFGGDRNSWDPVYYPNNGYEFLVVYGSDCNAGTDFGVKNLYIEKLKKDGNIFVYISKIEGNPDDVATKRKIYMEKAYGKA